MNLLWKMNAMPKNSLFLALSFVLLLLSACREQKPATLEISPEKLSFRGVEESKVIAIKCSSDDWTWEKGFPEWIYIDRVNDEEVKITVQPNLNDAVREGVVVFTCEELKRTISIEQGPQPTLRLSKSLIELDDVDGEVEIEVATNATEWKVVNKPEWIEVRKEENKLKIKSSANKEETRREGDVVIETEDKQAILKVSQAEKAYVKVSQMPSVFPYLGGEQVLTFESNRKDLVVAETHLFTVEMIGNSRLKIVVKRNGYKKERKASLSFYYKERNLLSIDVRQEESKLAEEQRAYLEKLYKATNGDQWTNNTNWLSDRPLSEWYGVEMSGDSEGSEIIVLNLRNNNLRGQLPEGLSILVSAKFIKLQDNALEGSLPDELALLNEVYSISLFNNNFTGNIPAVLGKKARKDGVLDIRGNRLSGVVPAIFIENPYRYKFCPQQEGYKFDNYTCK